MSTLKQQSPAFNLSEEAIGKSAARWPEDSAIRILSPAKASPLNPDINYSELDKIIRQIAQGLINHGAQKGDVILLRLNSDTPFALTFFASIAAGLIPVPLSPQLTEAECSFYLKDTKARWVAHSSNLAFPNLADTRFKGQPALINEAEILNFIGGPALECYAQTKADDPAFIIYTSGTTNRPKAVLHAQRTIIGRRPMQQDWHQMKRGDQILHAGDFNWTYTLGIGLMDPWVTGATACLYAGEKTPELWPRLIRENSISIFAAVPGIYRQILKYADFGKKDFTTLRHCLTAGEAMPKTLAAEWQAKTGTPLYEALGQSEISTYISTTSGMTLPKGAKGRIQTGRKVAILSDQTNSQNNNPHSKNAASPSPLPPNTQGLIAVHKGDPGLMLGYLEEGTTINLPLEGEWFLTGDQGSIDEDGFLTHLGRADDIMNASGYRVSPQEVETALTSLPLVSEAAVTEERISESLSIISAYIILNNPPANSDENEAIEETIGKELATKLARYKRPKAYYFVNAFPRNSTGKVVRKELHSLKPE